MYTLTLSDYIVCAHIIQEEERMAAIRAEDEEARIAQIEREVITPSIVSS